MSDQATDSRPQGGGDVEPAVPRFTRWYPGMPSPNPGGRPAAAVRIQELAREHTPAAIAKLFELMNDPKSSRVMQFRAANALLDRAWGKPAQTVFTPDLPPSDFDVNDIEAARRMAFILAKGLRAQVQEQQERVTATDAQVTSLIEESTNGEDSR